MPLPYALSFLFRKKSQSPHSHFIVVIVVFVRVERSSPKRNTLIWFNREFLQMISRPKRAEYLPFLHILTNRRVASGDDDEADA